MNNLQIDALRIEIAVLEEDIDSQNPKKHKFTIPVLLSGESVGVTVTPIKNSSNKSKPRSKITKIAHNNTIELTVPKEYTVFYGADIIPKGTRFLVAFVGGNFNDIRIIGRYDNLEE